jgi:hypothetical protein
VEDRTVRSLWTAAVVSSLAMAATAAAEPVVPAVPAAEDVVGTWRGAARWKACTFTGAPRVSVEVRRVDRRYQVDLGGAGDGLGTVGLDETIGARLAGTRDDLEVALTWKRGAPTLSLHTASGCTASAALRRDGTGIADCDAQRALASIAAGCSAMGEGRGEAAARVAEQAAGWKAARGARRTAAAAQCRSDAQTLRTALVRATCLPDPAQAQVAGTGIAECDTYVMTFQRYLRCNQVPVSAKNAGEESMRALIDSWRSLGGPAVPADVKRAAADACMAGTDALRQSATALGCDMR